MRQMTVWVPEGGRERVVATARDRGATSTLSLAGRGEDGPLDVVVLHVPNRLVGDVVAGLSAIEGLHLSMLPSGVLALAPPPEQAPEQVTDVTLRSPVEIFLSALQSIGSWRGFLAYAGIAGVVVWVGLYTNSAFLLVAAMLIAPFAGPAMNTAIATARGDWHLLRRSLARYAGALGVAVSAAAALSLVFRQDIATAQMVDTANISVVAVVLPLAAGAAGAINLAQSERSSLVSGAATGMLVAAALAPPAGLVGMAAVIGDLAMVRSGLFLLALQLLGINLAGAAVFRLVGLQPQGVRYPAGRKPVPAVAALTTLVLLAGLLVWQLTGSPDLQRSSVAFEAESAAQEAISASPGVEVVEVDARFPRPDVPGQSTLLVTMYVQPGSGAPEVDGDAVARSVQRQLLARFANVTPVVDVTVVDPP